MSLLVLEADESITEATSSTEELTAYVSKSWQNWDTLQLKKEKILAIVINNTLVFFSETLATPNYIQITALLIVLI